MPNGDRADAIPTWSVAWPRLRKTIVKAMNDSLPRRGQSADCHFVSVQGVAERFGLGASYDGWLRALDETEPVASFALPDRASAGDLLVKLGVPEEDLDAVLGVWPDAERDPEVWWLLERCHARLVAAMGNGDAFIDCPSLPRELGLPARCFWVFVYASTVDSDPRLPHGARHPRRHLVGDAR